MATDSGHLGFANRRHEKKHKLFTGLSNNH